MTGKKIETENQSHQHEQQTESQDAGGTKLPAETKGGERTRERPTFRPHVDIYETQEGLILLADVPGAKADSIEVSLEGRELALHVQVEDHAPEHMSPLHREYQVGDYERQFHLGGDFDIDRIQAELKEGVLKLTIPKAPKPEARRIEIRAS